MKNTKYVFVIMSIVLTLSCWVSRGQFIDSASGLLRAPSAEMGKVGTIMVTTTYHNLHTLPPAWDYNTFGYGFSIVILPRIEIGYVLTIFDERKSPSASGVITINQDRHFYAKAQILREGDFGKSWIPSFAVGISDPTTGETRKGANIDYTDFDVSEGNGYFNRYYAVLTKHFPSKIGVIGAHLGYQYNQRIDLPMNGPCAAIDWMPIWLQKENVVSTKLIAEYDARTFNIGAIVSLWKDHFDAMIELQAMKWISAGIRYKLVLKS